MRNRSQTSQEQTSTQVSNQLNLEGNNGSVVTGNNNVINTIVPGAVRDSLDFAGQVVDLNAKQNDRVFELIGGAFGKTTDALLEGQNNVLQYGAGVTELAVNSVTEAAARQVDGVSAAYEQANASLARNNENALVYGAGLTNAVLEANQKNTMEAFTFAGGAFTEASSLQNKALELTQQFAMETYDQIDRAQGRSYDFAGDAQDDAFKFTSGAFDRALDTVQEQSTDFQESLAKFAEKTINTAVNSTKTESAQTTEQIIKLTGDTTKYMMFAAVGLVAAFVLLRGSKS